MYFLATLFIGLLSLASCAKKPSHKDGQHLIFEPTNAQSKFENASEKGAEFNLLLGSARHLDLPIPITFSLISTSTEEQEKQARDLLKYKGSLSVKQTIDFYVREMEREGWDIADLSINDEGFLYCTKPTKLCGIMIQSQTAKKAKGKTEISLFVTQR